MITLDGEKIEVIDAHSHMGSRNKLAVHQIPRIMKFTAEDMMASMDGAGVDKVVTFAIGAGSWWTTAILITTSPVRWKNILTGSLIHASQSGQRSEGYFEGVGRGREAGPQRIKIHPLIEKCPANDKEKVYPLMEAAQHHGLPVLFHCGFGEDASPKRIAEVAKEFPKLSVILGHSGVIEGVRDAIDAAKKHENLSMDSSAVGWLPFFCETISWAGVDRVMYGSDHPFNPMEWEVAKIVKHAQKHLKLPIEDLRKIMGET